MKVVKTIVNCSYDSTVTAALVNANQEDTGFLAVYINPAVDNDVGATSNAADPAVPRVSLATNGTEVYGALATLNTATERCGVITKGIVPLKATGERDAATGAPETRGINGDSIGYGVTGSTTAGYVRRADAQAGTAPSFTYTDTGQGSGVIVGRNGSTIAWVDLSTNANATS